jgi:hypothetical protein
MHPDIIKVLYSPTNAQVIVLKNGIKIYVKIALTCFGAVAPSSGSLLFVLAKVTLVKIVNYGTSVYDSIGGDVAACISNVLVGVCVCVFVCVCVYRTVRE